MRTALVALGRRSGQKPAAVPPTVVAVGPHDGTYRVGEGAAGVLLCHGFTGSPRALRGWADHLAGAGFRVVVPRMPGHGTHWRELNQTRWPDWYGCLERELRILAATCSPVFVGGLSMGGCLALRLAQQCGDLVAALALVNPAVHSTNPQLRALPALRHVVPSLGAIGGDIAMPGVVEGAYDRTPLQALWSLTQLWREVVAGLPRVEHPLLIFKSTTDHVVDPSSLKVITDRVGSTDLTTVTLPHSYHVATLDYDAPLIFSGSSDFFRRHMSRD